MKVGILQDEYMDVKNIESLIILWAGSLKENGYRCSASRPLPPQEYS
jgi:hypothetical protein